MERNLKVCLVISAAIVFFAGLIVVGAGTLIYLNRDKIAKGFESWGERMQESAEAGRAFGEGSDQDECVQEALRRGEGLGSISSTTASEFLQACLQTARETDGFCEGVPGMLEILTSSFWARNRCEELGRKDEQGCFQVMQSKLAYCQAMQMIERQKGEEPEE